MSEQTPPPLPPRPPHGQQPMPVMPLSYQDYSTPRAGPPPVPPGRIILQFFAGLLGGGAISAVVWILGFNAVTGPGNGGLLLLIVPGVKLAIGITFLCIRGWRMLGGGILLSIALGFLIFFFTCVSQIK
jgi:hypothetical protein